MSNYLDNSIVPLQHLNFFFSFEILSFSTYFQHNVSPLLIVWHVIATLHLFFSTKLGIILAQSSKFSAKYTSNKMRKQIQNFSVCLRNAPAKKLLKTWQKALYITSTMASAYLGILPKAMIWYFNS